MVYIQIWGAPFDKFLFLLSLFIIPDSRGIWKKNKKKIEDDNVNDRIREKYAGILSNSRAFIAKSEKAPHEVPPFLPLCRLASLLDSRQERLLRLLRKTNGFVNVL